MRKSNFTFEFALANSTEPEQAAMQPSPASNHANVQNHPCKQ